MNLEREKEEGAAALKAKEDAVRLLDQARLAAEKMHRDEEARVKAAANAAALVKKNELDHAKRQSNQLAHKNLTISIDDPNDRHLLQVDPDTDDEVNDMAAAMGDMGGM